MKMELIQPFINAADAVLAETLQCPTRMGDVTMDEEAYRRKGVGFPGDDQRRHRRPHHLRYRHADRGQGRKLPYRDRQCRKATKWRAKPSANWPTW